MTMVHVRSGLSILVMGATLGLGGQEVLHERTFTLSHRNPRDTVTLRKVRDPRTGAVSVISSRPDRVANLQELTEVRQLLHREKRKRYGNVEPQLLAKLATIDPRERIPVVVYVRPEPLNNPPKCTEPNRIREDLEQLRAEFTAKRKQRKEVEASRAAAVAQEFGIAWKDSGGRALRDSLTAEEVFHMRFDPRITHIIEDVPSEPLADMMRLTNAGYNPLPVGGIGSYGQGVRVCQVAWNDILTNRFIDCLNALRPGSIDGKNVDKYYSGGTAEGHDHYCFKILWNTCPAAEFHYLDCEIQDPGHGSDFVYVLPVIRNRQIHSVSFSHGCGEGSFGPNHPNSLGIDRQAYEFGGFPVWSQPTANDGYEYEPDWQAYNMISVGNVGQDANGHFTLAGYTQTANPSGTDRELPHLVAPGNALRALMDDDCLPSTNAPGTSFSAPVVNGLAAAVRGADSRMGVWPEKVRAALILTAHNVDGGDWNTWEDGRDGTGTVSGTDAIAFAQEHVSVSPSSQYGGGTPVSHGMCAGYLTASDVNRDLCFRAEGIDVPGHHLRVVLLWNSSPGQIHNGLADLDLWVDSDPWPDNEYTYYSSSWQSNVEVVDAWDVRSWHDPVIQAHIYSVDFPAGSEGYFYYCIAWGWVKDHAD